MQIVIDEDIAGKIASEIAWRRGKVSITKDSDGSVWLDCPKYGHAKGRCIGSARENAQKELKRAQELVDSL